MMGDAEIISRFEAVIRAKEVVWINGEYLRGGEVVRWECFVRLLGEVVRVGFDEYLEKYEDAVDLYDAYVREEFSDVGLALMFVLKSFPRVAEEMRDGES
jgi:calcineurin-like phosphoesterase family protein